MSQLPPPEQRRAQIVGTGLIGGSVGLALRRAGWFVTGTDREPSHIEAALDRGAIHEAGIDETALICVIALPVGSVAEVACELIDRADWIVTDVASVKLPVVEAVAHPRFVGGHPMAGSEQDGVAGSTSSMFDGAAWVLTPSEITDPEAYALIHSVVAGLGADVITMDAESHDRVVAMVSHVPHLTAATLMGIASKRAEDQHSLLRMAAGGFRDMTRVASGNPAIWPDICEENSLAIVGVLDELIAQLTAVRSVVKERDREALLDLLSAARKGRLNLPVSAPRPAGLVELRIGVPDEPGVLGTITALASELAVNIFDIEIAHSVEGPRGVLILLVDTSRAQELIRGLEPLGYSVSVQEL